MVKFRKFHVLNNAPSSVTMYDEDYGWQVRASYFMNKPSIEFWDSVLNDGGSEVPATKEEFIKMYTFVQNQQTLKVLMNI